MANELEDKKNKGKKFLNGFAGQLLLFLFVLVGAFSAGIFAGKGDLIHQASKPVAAVSEESLPGNKEEALTVTNVEEIISPASDLITTKYCYTDADTYENYKEFFGAKMPFTTDKTVFTYDGVVSVGIDLSAVSYDILNDKKEINITLPKINIIANEIDTSSFKYPFVSDSVFNSTEMSDYTGLLDDLKKRKAEEVTNNKEFMDSAKVNTENVLRGFLTTSEATKDYTVNFK